MPASRLTGNTTAPTGLLAKLAQQRDTNTRFDQLTLRWKEERMRTARIEATAENKLFDLKQRHMRAEAQWENADFDRRRRQARTEAEWENADFDRRKRAEDRLDRLYNRAHYENDRRNFETDYNAAHAENRARDQAQQRRIDSSFAGHLSRGGHPLLSRLARGAMVRAAGGTVSEAAMLGQVEGLGALGGPVGLGIATAGVLTYEAAKTAYRLPGAYAGAIDAAVSGAAPYYGLLSGSASLGLAGGFDGNSLTSSIYTHGAAPDWMKRYGLSPQDVLGLVQQSGQPVSSAQQARAVATSIMAASQSQFLGGLDPSTYAGMLGTFTTLSGSGNNPNATGNFDGSGGTGGGQANDFWRRMQGVMANATAWGLDHAKVASTISSMMQQAAMSGAGHVDSNALTGFWSQMASGGLASMRDGSGILAAQQSLATESGSMGYSGNTMATMAFQNYVNHNGGLPTSMAALGKQLHFDPSTLSPAQRQQATWALQAAQRGDIIGYSSMAAPFLQTDPTLQMQINTGWAQSFNLPGYMAAAAAGGMGGGMGAVASMMAGAGPSLLKGTMLGWSDIDPAEAASIKKYAKANGLDPNVVAALINHESSFRPGAFNGSGGGFGAIGLGQIRQSALQDLQQNGMDKDVTPQMLYNADVNTRVSADYLKLLMKRYGSYDLALQHYYGSQDPNANAQYAAFIEQGAVGLGSNQNQMMKSVLATQGQANTQAGEQSANLAQTLGSGPLPDALLSLNGTVVTATSTIAAFAQAVQHASYWLSRATGGTVGIHGTAGRHVPVKQP